MSTEGLNRDDRYTVAGWRGIAFYYAGPHTEPDEDTEGSGYERDTGNVRMAMVGDDHVWVVDPEDVQTIGEDDYCHECGQVGCSADGRDRSESGSTSYTVATAPCDDCGKKVPVPDDCPVDWAYCAECKARNAAAFDSEAGSASYKVTGEAHGASFDERGFVTLEDAEAYASSVIDGDLDGTIEITREA